MCGYMMLMMLKGYVKTYKMHVHFGVSDQATVVMFETYYGHLQSMAQWMQKHMLYGFVKNQVQEWHVAFAKISQD